ncbi:MAG TPA: (deoxy)nucleoside triphosphate pyrophosphohydrolase [Mycobacteriales bacterium]|nr:(deoxy)nucleoside triphosphate pyrophosphohydrolase [Mycobacteriales bacterium]
MRVHVVGAAILRDDPPAVLSVRRTEPPRLAGLWEFPGGKVEQGEDDEQALVREVEEELGLAVTVGERLGGELPIGQTAVLRVYLCRVVGTGEPRLSEHDAMRWLGPNELDDVPWIPVDQPLLPQLRRLLSAAGDSSAP